MSRRWHVCGLDLGQAQDYSALAVLEWSPGAVFTIGHLQRWPLGTPYTQVAADVKAMVAREPLRNPALVIDGTGVGRAVVEMFQAEEMAAHIMPVSITAGHQAATSSSDGWLRVPKKELVSALQVLLQSRRLVAARGLPMADVLAREMAAFRVKVTAAANEEFSAWRERDHDDIVLAVALAAWVAEEVATCTVGDEPDDSVART